MNVTITVKAEIAQRLADNINTTALAGVGVTAAEIAEFRQELQRAAIALRESKSPSEETVTVGGNQVSKWFARHGLDQKY